MNEPHIVTRTYDFQLNGGKTVHLRLTVAAQLRLKNKFNEDALDVILSASSDPERLLAVLDEALHFNDDGVEKSTESEDKPSTSFRK